MNVLGETPLSTTLLGVSPSCTHTMTVDPACGFTDHVQVMAAPEPTWASEEI